VYTILRMSEDNGSCRRQESIPSDTAEGKRVQNDIVAQAHLFGYPEPELFAIRLALEEALVNSIKHGNGSDPSKKVHITYEIDPEQVRIQIKDAGPGFDPDAVPDPTAPEFLERPCGRGLMLMRHYMSAVTHSLGGTCVEMTYRKGHHTGPAE